MKPQPAIIADKKLRHNVISQLDYEPEVTSTNIGVAVADGVVMLSGFVHNYAEKVAAERAVLHVYGVKAVANELQVKLRNTHTDADIAQAIVHTYRNNLVIPSDKIEVAVKAGFVTLTGKVEWHHQRKIAENAIRFIPGLKGILNLIEVLPLPANVEIKNKIEEALMRSAQVDARKIKVASSGHTVTLTGTVSSWLEKQYAEKAAWSAPGVAIVINEIKVAP